MTGFKVLGATLVFSALLSTPASAWEPAAAEAADPTFSIYSGMHGSIYSHGIASQTPLGDASRLHMSVRPHRGNHTTGVKRY
jgi:hypothetical protein